MFRKHEMNLEKYNAANCLDLVLVYFDTVGSEKNLDLKTFIFMNFKILFSSDFKFSYNITGAKIIDGKPGFGVRLWLTNDKMNLQKYNATNCFDLVQVYLDIAEPVLTQID